MHGRLYNKTAVITGGAQGIGAAIAKAFVNEGARVAIVDINAQVAAETAEKLRSEGANAIGLAADVSDEAAVQAAMEQSVAAFGTIDILVNNAGIDTTSLVKDMPVQLWDQMMAVNLRGVFLPTRAVLPGMIKQKFGRIINIASQLAHKGAPLMAHYCASKAGVIGFTKSLAYEVARDGITVNAICPGPIDTALFRAFPEEWKSKKLAEVPLGRLGTAKEIAPTAVMLAADDGGYYLGATLNPNGGDVMI
jgi:3-oxoacyl-[acyl-carrier protein] reductase